jgi:hypothetical protein
MKIIYSLILFIGLITNIQAQSFTQNWKKLANATDFAWFTNDNNVTTLAYNPVTDKLLVSKRNDRIFVINPATGAQEDTLSTRSAALGTEGLKYNKIRVTSDGVIYAMSLQTGAGVARIYRWASQRDTPTLAATFWVTERAGDAFGLSGTGTNTVLYASGAGTANNAFSIYILTTTDGRTFTRESKVTMTSSPTSNQQWANRTVEPEGTGVNSPIWIKGGGFIARKIAVGAKTDSLRMGTVVTTIVDGTSTIAGEASIGYGGMRLLTTANNTKFLVFAGGNNPFAGTKMNAITIAVDTVHKFFGRDSLNSTANYVTNANGTGDVSFKVNANGTFTVFYLGTNNGIAAATSRMFTSNNDVKNVTNLNIQTLGNPFYNDLNLLIKANKAGKATVNVQNSVGRILVSKQADIQIGETVLNLPANYFPSGLYIVSVNDGVSQQVVKVVKQ